MSKATAEMVSKALEGLESRHAEANARLLSFITEKSDQIEDHGRWIEAKGDEAKSVAADMAALQSDMNVLREALKSFELKGMEGKGIDSSKKHDSFARAVTKHENFKHQRDKPAKLQTGYDIKDAGYAWARKGLNDFDGTTNPDLVKPWYRPDIIEFPKNRPLFRDLFPVVQIPVATDTVSVDVELVEYAWVATLTAAVIATATTAPLSTVVGLGITEPWNEITFSDGTNADTVKISSITDNTVTFAPALAFPYAVANTRVSSKCYLCTAEGEQKPQSLDETEAINCPVCKLASFQKASMEILEDDTRTQLFINRRLLSRQARNEDKAILYGPGGAKQILGIFPNTAIPTSNWSGSEAGATKIDHIINVIYSLAEYNYSASAVTVTPYDHRDIIKQKDTTKSYIFVKDLSMGTPNTFLGIALLWTNQLERDPAEAGGDFVVADFAMGGTIYDRMADRFEVGLDGNDFTKNMRTLLVERRFCFAAEQPLAIAKGTFNSQP